MFKCIRKRTHICTCRYEDMTQNCINIISIVAHQHATSIALKKYVRVVLISDNACKLNKKAVISDIFINVNTKW